MSDLQQRLQLALESARMAIWDSSVVNGNVLDGTVSWSREGAVLLGLEPGAFGQPFRLFLTFVHEHDRAELVSRMQKRVSDCAGYELEYRIVRADGAIRWLVAKAQTICDGAGHPERTIGVVRDITEHKAQETQLLQQKELAEVTLASIGDGVITTDALGNTTFINRIAEQLTGWSNGRAVGADVDRVLRVVHDSAAELSENVARKCLRLRQAVGSSGRSDLITLEGRHIPIEDSAAPIWSRSGEMLGAVAVFRDISHERRLVHQLNWQAAHDSLTGLLNRHEFETELAHALSTAKNEGQQHALLFLDLDRFSVINDTCGHAAGDLLLQLLSKMLHPLLREADSLARLGGDELGVLLSACPLPRAIVIANTIREAIRSFRFPFDKHFLDVTVSIGLVVINEDSPSVTGLLNAADHACSVAKEQGRNRVHLYREADAVITRRQGEMRWVARLAEALELEHFRLFTQPIVALRDGAEGHEEVLVRIDDGGQLILPGDFIPAAERYGLMAPIDRWVIENVCRHIQAERLHLAQREPAGGAVPATARVYSINLSGISLNDDTLCEHIITQFAEYGVDPAMICFEITETAIIANLPKAQNLMAHLTGLGCRFALDDFGSGLSSFAYLRSLKVDYLKIDGVFVRGIAGNHINRALVRAINEVGHVMGIQTVAEFVEDGPTLEVIRDLGIDFAQGYAVGTLRPLALA